MGMQVKMELASQDFRMLWKTKQNQTYKLFLKLN